MKKDALFLPESIYRLSNLAFRKAILLFRVTPDLCVWIVDAELVKLCEVIIIDLNERSDMNQINVSILVSMRSFENFHL